MQSNAFESQPLPRVVAILQAIRIISFREVDMVDILDVSGQ
jgi:hypothetical protein